MAQWDLRRRLEEAEAQRRLAAGLSATADETLMERPIVVDPAPERTRASGADTAPGADRGAAPTRASRPAPRPPSAPPAVRADEDTIDLRTPLAPWHDPAPRAADPAPVAIEDDLASGVGAGLSPRRAAAITLPLWQGSNAGPRGAMVHEHAPATASPQSRSSDARPASPTGSRANATDRVATRQPTKDRCPQCSGKVRLDRFDLVDAVAHMSCTDCGFTYQAKSPKL